MKITIITVYNSENSGSFLQAYALEQILINQGHEVRFLYREVKGTSHSFWGFSRLREVVKYLMKFDVIGAFFPIRRWFLYNKLIGHFQICKVGSDFYNDTSLFILGSDTIWNFNDKYFVDNAGFMTGRMFEHKKVISYAGSAANTSNELFKKVLSEFGNFNNLSCVMVRDNHTAELVKSVCDKPVSLVCDPTFLCDSNMYDNVISSKKLLKRKYLLLYYTGNIDEPLKDVIIDYAKSNDLAIISLLSHLRWCDNSYVGAPHFFIPLFKGATAVVTNTFHGCAFSIIYDKQFAVKDCKKNKVNELLNSFNLVDHMFKEEHDFEKCISLNSNMAKRSIIEETRNNSLRYLLNEL